MAQCFSLINNQSHPPGAQLSPAETFKGFRHCFVLIISMRLDWWVPSQSLTATNQSLTLHHFFSTGPDFLQAPTKLVAHL